MSADNYYCQDYDCYDISNAELDRDEENNIRIQYRKYVHLTEDAGDIPMSMDDWLSPSNEEGGLDIILDDD